MWYSGNAMSDQIVNGDDRRSQLDALRRRISHRQIDLGIDSRSKLAAKAGVSKDTLDNLYKANRKEFPYANDLVKIARALETDAETLINGERENNEAEQEGLCTQIRSRPQLANLLSRLAELSDDDLETVGLVLEGSIQTLRARRQKGKSSERDRA